MDISTGRYYDKEWKLVGTAGCYPDRLTIPLKRRKPTVYAVWNDWAHESVPIEFIGEMFDVIDKCPQHTLLID